MFREIKNINEKSIAKSKYKVISTLAILILFERHYFFFVII